MGRVSAIQMHPEGIRISLVYSTSHCLLTRDFTGTSSVCMLSSVEYHIGIERLVLIVKANISYEYSQTDTGEESDESHHS